MAHHGGPWPFWRHAMRAAFGPFGAGGPAVKRGIVRVAVLRSLLEGPKHGYQVIQDIERRTGGFWRPSAGSVYPMLQQLEDEGLVRSQEADGRRTYALTDDGRRAAEAVGWGPMEHFFRARDASTPQDLRVLAAQLVAAAVQVERVGSAAARARADTVLREARRALYRILAEDDAGASGGTAAEGQADSTGASRPGSSGQPGAAEE